MACIIIWIMVSFANTDAYGGTLPNQNLVFGTLGDISDKKINTPAILIIGDVVSMYKDIYNYQGD